MTATPIKFADRASLGLQNEALKKAMASAEVGIFANADKAMLHPDYQEWRNLGAQIKDYVLDNLADLLVTFEKNATAAGAQVHWAIDAQDARKIVVDLAKKHKAKNAIKSKSMLSEEIELNAGLAEHDIDVLETDLGEYVVQISKGHPSHIIAPIIHMTGDQIRELFQKHHGDYDRSTNEKVVQEAREQLRPRMINAELGMSGANFLVASTGSTVLVTNEGNGRYSATAPHTRITLAGIEKVIPSFTELATMLRLLPRAATGQTSTSYVSIATGANQTHKPHTHHIVLVDNGRSKMLKSKYRKMLRCIRCGSCMNHCPVYKKVGGLSYNSVYSGPMGSVLSPNLFGSQHNELPHVATMCGACNFACPVQIPLPDLMRNLREDQVANGEQPGIESFLFSMWKFCATKPRLYRLFVRVVSWVIRKFASSNKVLRWLPFAKGWFLQRNIIAPSSAPFRHLFKTSTSK